MKVKESTNNIVHFVDDKNYYFCNRAVGKHNDCVVVGKGFLLAIKRKVCKNCIRKAKI